MPGKRHSATTASRLAAAKGGSKRSKVDTGPGDGAFFVDSDEERTAGKSRAMPSDPDEEEEEEAMETAEEKRLRLAKEYLTQLRTHVDDDLDRRRGVTGGDESEAEDDDGSRARRHEDHVAQLLQLDAAQAAGRVQRQLVHTITIPEFDEPLSAGTAHRGHRLPPTALALSNDDAAAWTVAKDGSVCKWDIATGQRTQLQRPGLSSNSGKGNAAGQEASGPEWVKRAARATSRLSLLTAAVSSDGALLAVGGGDRKVHVYDARTGSYVQAFPGHRDAVTSLAFREGTHTLFSASLDRTVKLWSLDDRAYMDTLFGHQAEVLCVDVGRADRAVTCGADRTCRVWKIPEESQLIFKHGAAGAAQTLDCCRMITATEWVSGASDGTLQLWTQLKRKPISVIKAAHGPKSPGLAGCVASSSALADATASPPDVTGWVQSVATVRGSDLVASGAGDGAIRLWQVTSSKAGGISGLAPVGALPARGWVNGLAIAKDARFVVAAMGQEPRMGRWARDAAAHNGLLLHKLQVQSSMD